MLNADIVGYRVGFTTENEDLAIAHFRVDEMLDNILVETKADEFQLWLSDNAENNFRFKLTPTYKATRKAPKPRWHEEIKEYLVVKWGARIAHGQEADDALGIEQTKTTHFLELEGGFGLAVPKKEGSWLYGPVSTPEGYGDSIICSIDKDLLMIPGSHYNFVKKEFTFVTPIAGTRAFYAQCLVGDVSDNIKGCRGIGPVRARRILDGLDTEQELFSSVRESYLQTGAKDEDLLLAGRLLKIRQVEDEPLWEFPKV